MVRVNGRKGVFRSAVGTERQKDHKVKTSLVYIVRHSL